MPRLARNSVLHDFGLGISLSLMDARLKQLAQYTCKTIYRNSINRRNPWYRNYIVPLAACALCLASCSEIEPANELLGESTSCFRAEVVETGRYIDLVKVIGLSDIKYGSNRCSNLFATFSGDAPDDATKSFIVANIRLNEDLFRKLQVGCGHGVVAYEPNRAIIADVLYRCHTEYLQLLGDELNDRNLGEVFVARYGGADPSLNYLGQGNVFPTYMSGGVVEDSRERLIPICIVLVDFLVPKKEDPGNSSKLNDPLDGCLFRFVDQY